LDPSGKYDIVLENQAVPYSVSRSGRSCRVWLKVGSRTGLTIVVPAGYDIAAIPGLLAKKSHWILGKLAKYGMPPLPAAGRKLKSGDSVPYLGRRLKVIERFSPRSPESVTLKATRIVVNAGSQDGRLNELVKGWYRLQAEKLLAKRTGELCRALGVTCNRLSVREAKTRWGSCSQKGNLSLNWKLIMAPEAVIDYVIIHELSHLKELNHSKKFWSLVAARCPQWRKHKRWLRDHEAELGSQVFCRE
jgi:predicted metal-dependent hydrolase